MALLAFIPWYFSWTGVIVAVITARLSGLLGINIGYHRLLTHRGFRCPKWLEHVLVVIAICCVEDTPARWVAVHRRHHQHADEQPDPHSPLVNFLWGHVGWLIIKNPELNRLGIYDRYAKDILRDPFYVALERNWLQLKIILIQWLVFFGLGFLAELAMGGTAMQALQFGLSILIWGVFVRTVLVWHQTWAVNSITHLWGYRNYQTDEDSRNNVFIGILAHGEGWHNNHHADPALGASWSQMVGVRHHLADHSPVRKTWTCDRRCRAESLCDGQGRSDDGPDHHQRMVPTAPQPTKRGEPRSPVPQN